MITNGINLKKHPEVAEEVANSPVGGKLKLYVTIKTKDEEQLTYTIDEVEVDGDSAEPSSDAEIVGDDEDGTEDPLKDVD